MKLEPQSKLAALVLVVALGVLPGPQAVAATPTAAAAPRQQNSLYYRVGGGDPTAPSANPNSLNLKFNLTGNLNLGYSCGKFDIGAAFSYYMNEFKNLGATLSAALGAAVMALPMYIFQRAQPGLYEIFQSYWAKAQVAINAALKTCEEMEAQIKAGGDPYQDYLNMAKGETWKENAAAGDNVIESKQKVQKNGGDKGVEVFPGIKRGGKNQPPLRVVHDVASVGYNVTMNKPPAASKDTSYPPNTRLGKLWATPRDAGDWAVSVLGDQEVSTCDDGSVCGKGDSGLGKAVATGLGLQPKYQASFDQYQVDLKNIVNASGVPSNTDLAKVSAPSVGITTDVIESLRRLPPGSRETMTTRLSGELAMAATIERALMVRNLLQSGMTAANYDKPVDDARRRVEQLNRYIDDLLFDSRVRKEIVSESAQILLENDRNASAARSTSVAPGREGTSRGLEDGKVKP